MVKVLTALATAMLAVSGCTTSPSPDTSAAAIVTTASAGSAGFVSAGGIAVVGSSGSCVRTSDWSGNCGSEPEQIVELAPTPVVQDLPILQELPAVLKEPVKLEPAYVRETLNGSALFELDSAELSPEGFQALEDLVGRIGEVSGAGSIEIVGHTDDTGPEEYNRELSAKRAQSVRQFLQGKVGGMPIKASARGELSPIADNSTEEGRAKNRRVEVLVSQSSVAQ